MANDLVKRSSGLQSSNDLIVSKDMVEFDGGYTLAKDYVDDIISKIDLLIERAEKGRETANIFFAEVFGARHLRSCIAQEELTTWELGIMTVDEEFKIPPDVFAVARAFYALDDFRYDRCPNPEAHPSFKIRKREKPWAWVRPQVNLTDLKKQPVPEVLRPGQT